MLKFLKGYLAFIYLGAILGIAGIYIDNWKW
jgi:hypothetical protein